jgi:hypothetical protein
MAAYKTVSDTIHGSIRVEGVALDLLETLEVQRLSAIRQLGLTYLVFPGANHSRLEHSLGAYHVAREACRQLSLRQEEVELVSSAALLHDIGHGPYSHTLETVLAAATGRDHMEISKGVIQGDEDTASPDRAEDLDAPRIPEVLGAHGLDPQAVADLVRGCTWEEGLEISGGETRRQRYLADIIHSTVDCDQVDYLLRDAHYTGVAHGVIDYHRLLQTLAIHRGALSVDRKGLPAVEGMLVARALMYSSVYFHKTVRIAEAMMARAVERMRAPMASVQSMIDSELFVHMMTQGGFQREVARRIKYRRLFKRAVHWGEDELAKEEREELLRLAKDSNRRLRAEDAICHRIGAPEGSVLIDIPMPELLLSEPRYHRTDLMILDDGKPISFHRASAFSRSLRVREVSDWVAMVAASPRYRDDVSRAAPKVLFG